MLVYQSPAPISDFTTNICQAFITAYVDSRNVPHWSVHQSVVDAGPIWLLVDLVDCYMVFDSPVLENTPERLTVIHYRIHLKRLLGTSHREACVFGSFRYKRPSMMEVVHEFTGYSLLPYPQTALSGAKTTFDQLATIASSYGLSLPPRMLINHALKFYPDGRTGILLEARLDAPMAYGCFELVV